MLGEDGVVRTFGGPPERVVFDAVGLSPAQIKQMLDMQPWSQEIQDTFRGVDGRKVVDHDALFNPPDYLRPPRFTKEEFEAKCRETEEYNRTMRENIEKEREEGVDVATKYACRRVQADYDLTPKESK